MESKTKEYNMQEKIHEEIPSNEMLINMLRSGNDAAQDLLLAKCKPLVLAKSRTYFLMGGDRDDLVQEGMIGLYKAIRDFDSEKSPSFYSFADICITRQMLTAIKMANRQKHLPLNSYLSLDFQKTNDEQDSWANALPHTLFSDPEEILIHKESKDQLERKVVAVLSNFELRILRGYLQGNSYEQLAKKTHCTIKSIDNALQRIRKKVAGILKKS